MIARERSRGRDDKADSISVIEGAEPSIDRRGRERSRVESA